MFIVATISKNSYAPEKIREIILAGASVLRFNFSHGSPEQMFEHIQVARQVIADLGMEGQVKIMADLPGAKLRLGQFEPFDYPIKVGQMLTFKSAKESADPAEFIPVNAEGIGRLVTVGQEITIADGSPSLRVKEILSDESFVAEALMDGFVIHMKGLNIGQGVDLQDHITPEFLAHADNLSSIKPDWIALSFVNSLEFVERAKAILRQKMQIDELPPIVAKVETAQGVEKINDIAQAVDVLMVARGDLAVTTPFELLGLEQKRIIRAAKKAGKPVIVATQLLESLLDGRVPTRSEILDLTNIVLDGADGIMFAKETGLSLTPGFSVAMARKIIEAVENNREKYEGQ